MNNNISSTNFRGSYLMNFSKTGPQMREAFEKAIGPKKRITFNDFGAKDRILYVMKNSKDYDAAEFIKKNELRFKYMPEMDTRLRFDTYFPEEVKEYMAKEQPKVITKTKELMEFVTQNRLKNRAKYGSEKSFYDTIKDKLFINVRGEEVKDSFGVTTIEDKVNEGLVKISPKSKYGFRYVYVKPANKYEDTRRLAIDSDGNRVAEFTTPDGMKKFDKHFKKAIDNHLNREQKGNRKLKYS